MIRCRPTAAVSVALLTCAAALPCAAQEQTGPARAGGNITLSTTRTAVELLEAGSEPRQMLRYEIEPGRRELYTVTIESSSSIMMGDTAMPVERLELKLEMQSEVVRLEGSLMHIEGELVDAGRLQKDEQDRSLSGMMMQRMLRNLRGLQVRSTRDIRGIIHSDEIVPPQDAPPPATQLAEGLRHALTQSGIHLPNQPVGTGSRWRVAIPTLSQGMHILQTVEYTLVSREGDVLNIEMDLRMTSDPQIVQGMQLTSMSGGGGGSARIDLRRIAAIEMTLEFDSESVYLVGPPGSREKRVQSSDVVSTLRSRPKD
jgi:hypothetical protein